MDLKKIKYKKSVQILDLFLITIIGIFLFVGLYSFVAANAEESGVNIPDGYQSKITELNNNSDNLNQNALDIRDSIEGIQEASNIVQVAFNGMTGMVALFKLPLEIWDSLLSSLKISFYFIGDYIPTEIINVLTIVLSTVLAFAFLRFVTQRGNDA